MILTKIVAKVDEARARRTRVVENIFLAFDCVRRVGKESVDSFLKAKKIGRGGEGRDSAKWYRRTS